MEEEEYFRDIAAVFSLLTAFIHKVTERIAKGDFISVYTSHSDIVNRVLYGSTRVGNSSGSGSLSIPKQEILSCSEKEICGAFDDIDLFTLNFHILHHIAKDLRGQWRRRLPCLPFRAFKVFHKAISKNDFSENRFYRLSEKSFPKVNFNNQYRQ